jgi:hypothetical protein
MKCFTFGKKIKR